MKLLLIGPYPPPHGGISVHMAETKKQLEQAGVSCCVLNLNRSAPKSDQYICFRSSLGLLRILFFHARRGWIFHLHTNGHNGKSWLLALACGLIGQLAPACLLTVHSGMAPLYLNGESLWRRHLARIAGWLYDRIVAVNHQIQGALISLGISPDRLEVVPAHLSTAPSASLPEMFEELVQQSQPLITTVLFYRPEYGFELLIHALGRLRYRYPNLRCLFMGSGEQQEEAERLIQEEGMKDTIKLLGDLPHEHCLALISVSDLFVRPTLEDADSISVREALSLGIPTVVSDVGHRPPGTLLFRAGDRNDLVSKMEAALATYCGRAPVRRFSQSRTRFQPQSRLMTPLGCSNYTAGLKVRAACVSKRAKQIVNQSLEFSHEWKSEPRPEGSGQTNPSRAREQAVKGVEQTWLKELSRN
ncbi:MAG: glycosyltransferase family 4 protein [Acidobacteria bacterium]|nr:glycosyltransferase family 4 protein [Acidobacteriota bacterium]